MDGLHHVSRPFFIVTIASSHDGLIPFQVPAIYLALYHQYVQAPH